MARFERLFPAAVLIAAVAGSGHALRAQEPQVKPNKLEIAITEQGFSPERLNVTAGVEIELVFIRKTDKTCATEVAVPSLKVKKALPLNEPVSIVLTPAKDDVTFACGMNMLKGKLVVKAS